MFPEVSNLVMTATVGVKLNLDLVSKQIIESSYNPRRFSAAVIRFRKPRGTVLLFPNGKMVCNGVTSKRNGITSFRIVTRRLTRMGYNAKVISPKVANIVATSTLDFKIDLVRLYNEYYRPRNVGFCEPECFPNLVVPLANTKAMIFRTGKVIFTGAKSFEDIVFDFDVLFPILEKYKKEAKL